MKKIFLLFALIGVSNVQSAEHYQSGNVYDITSTEAGLLVRLEGNIVPTSCPNPNNWGWMVIPEDETTMTSVALAMFIQGKTSATIYTNGTVGSFCKITQYDPH